MTFKIVTDSCCNLPEDIIDDLDLTIFPLVFMIGEEQHQSYLKGEVTDLQQFYTHMREGKVFTTSLPNLKDAEADLKAIFESGNDVLYLGFSSALSGTYEAINLLGNDLVKNYPDRTFIAIDTLAASLGQGLLVYYAAKMRRRQDHRRSCQLGMREPATHVPLVHGGRPHVPLPWRARFENSSVRWQLAEHQACAACR